MIPNKLKIGGFDWEVITDNKDFHNGNQSYGYISPNDLKIFIEPEINEQKQKEALLHEIIHACVWNSGFPERLDRLDRDLNEDLTTMLGRSLYQVLKDNKLTF